MLAEGKHLIRLRELAKGKTVALMILSESRIEEALKRGRIVAEDMQIEG
jgi:hypothetical protein